MDGAECFICDKHSQGDSAEGGVLFEDDLVYVGHLHTMGEESTYRGWLVVETKRHVGGLGDLTDDEARAIGSISNRAARVLRETAGAEHVYAFVYGDRVPHHHVHLSPRYPDTPREYWGSRLADWPDAPQVNETEMRRLIRQLAIALE